MTLADYLREQEPWKLKAACRDENPALFFPDRGSHPRERVAAARKICRGCVVQVECLKYALSYSAHYDFGIYAGTNAAERRVLRRERAA